MDGVGPFPRSDAEIFEDFQRRRGALLRALTDEVDDFWQQCDPERDNLCLYGHRDGSWTVDLPAEEVPPELPEPCLGINFARDGMAKKDWLALVAVHSDAWLMAVSSFFSVKLDAAGSLFGWTAFTQALTVGMGLKLFRNMNTQPTLFEMVTARNRQKPAGPSGGNNLIGGAGAPGAKRRKEGGREFSRPSESQFPSGRKMRPEDFTVALKGRQAELFWPDNNLWYLVEIMSINSRAKTAKITYATGEEEELNMEEIVNDGHMCLL